MTKKCPYCVAEIPTEARKCKFCGEWVEKPPTEASPGAAAPAKLPTPFTACPSCHAAAPDGALLCVQCGYDVRIGQKRYVRYQPLAPPKEETTQGGTPSAAPPSVGRKWKYVLAGGAVAAVVLLAIVMTLAWQWSAQQAEYQEQTAKSLGEIGLALLMYQEQKGHLPGNICDPQGKPLLSWRVELLPYLNQDALYKSFKLDQPWDSEHNRALLEKMPLVFAPGVEPTGLAGRNPRLRQRPPGHTFIQGFVGKGTIFEDKPKVSFADVNAQDGVMNTLALVDAGTPVPWTKPQDLPYDPAQPLPSLGGLYEGGKAIAVLCDGKPAAIRPDADPQKLREYVTYDDNQPPVPDAVFGAIPAADENPEFLRFWGPIVGGSALALLLLVVFVRWWLVMADG
jgi:hypothetical protein